MSGLRLRTQDDYLICKACGTQYPVLDNKDECAICDDPRQFVPPEGQSFTTLRKMRQDEYRNVWWQDPRDTKIWFIRTEPHFGIGERAILLPTAAGNILWDLFAFLDQETVDKIGKMGGLKAIVISHPHYYSTYADWARTFNCPVYVARLDKQWLTRLNEPEVDVRFLTETYNDVVEGSGVNVIVAGGHFPGALLLLWEERLLIADTIVPSPSASNPVPGKPGVISFTFFWSIPNRIPIPPDEVLTIWKRLKPLEFHSAYGAFKGMDIHTVSNELERGTGGVKGRLLESCKIFIKAMGWNEHAMLLESL